MTFQWHWPISQDMVFFRGLPNFKIEREKGKRGSLKVDAHSDLERIASAVVAASKSASEIRFRLLAVFCDGLPQDVKSVWRAGHVNVNLYHKTTQASCAGQTQCRGDADSVHLLITARVGVQKYMHSLASQTHQPGTFWTLA